MSFEAFKKAAASSKVLLFVAFAVAITVALRFGLVDGAWYQDTIAKAFFALMGGYSIVEAARAIGSGKITLADLLRDPASAVSVHAPAKEKEPAKDGD